MDPVWAHLRAHPVEAADADLPTRAAIAERLATRFPTEPDFVRFLANERMRFMPQKFRSQIRDQNRPEINGSPT